MSKKHRGKKQKTQGTYAARLEQIRERMAAYRLKRRKPRRAS